MDNEHGQSAAGRSAAFGGIAARALVLASCGLAGGAGCTYRAAIGGHGRIHGDNTIGVAKAPRGAPILSVGAGPCLRWPRVRTALTLDFALRGVSLIPFAASETLWLFHEGPARRNNDGSARTSFALKGRLAGGWNGVTDRWIAEAGIGLAAVLDSNRLRNTLLSTNPEYTGDFHALSLDLIATYAPDRQGEDEVWLGAQLSFELNGLSSPPGAIGGRRKPGRYGGAVTGQSTDCNGGVVP